VANIGEIIKEVEYEPLPDTPAIPEPSPVTPETPEREGEPVPA
jgi:hypothetical protein